MRRGVMPTRPPSAFEMEWGSKPMAGTHPTTIRLPLALGKLLVVAPPEGSSFDPSLPLLRPERAAVRTASPLAELARP
jgi:hypothetical protein